MDCNQYRTRDVAHLPKPKHQEDDRNEGDGEKGRPHYLNAPSVYQPYVFFDLAAYALFVARFLIHLGS